MANDSGRVNLFDNLQPGETDAIQLALQTGAQWLITDDLAARKAADSRGIGIVGVLGVLILSKRAGLIPEVKPFVLRLLDLGFRLGYTVCGEALRMAGEDPSDLLEEIHDEP